tara:strand:+ start:136 stop:363 length:228 start_codon:yes stop_codon:yes gene_type:complete
MMITPHQHGIGFTVSVDTGDSDWEIWVDVSLSEGGIKVEVRRNDESLGLEDDLMASEFEDWDKLGVEVRGRRASP